MPQPKNNSLGSQIGDILQDWGKILDAISDIIFVQDRDFTIIRANKACCQALGLSRDEVIGKKCYQLLHNMNEPWPSCPFEKTRQDKLPHTEEVDDPRLGKELLVTTSPIFDEGGQFLGSVHTAKDISGVKNTERQLKKKIGDLEAFQKIAVERELKMIELKKQLKRLQQAGGG